MIKKEHSEFIQKLHLIDPNIQIVNEYMSSLGKIIVSSKYGNCAILPSALLRGVKPFLGNAVNKTEYWINMAKEVHGDKYDYSLVDYLDNKSKVKIICKKHGVFEQTPSNHLKYNCYKCGELSKAINNTKEQLDFIERCNKIHNFYYSYNKVIYINCHTKVNVLCYTHGIFSVTPSNHLRNRGCPKCASVIRYNKKLLKNGCNFSHSMWENQGSSSKLFINFKLYILRCWNENEEFYKVGKTFKNIKQRFKSNRDLPYNYEIIQEISDTALIISKLETHVHRLLEAYKYKPLIYFRGVNECFSTILKIEFTNNCYFTDCLGNKEEFLTLTF